MDEDADTATTPNGSRIGDERRRHRRRPVYLPLRVASSSETPLPQSETVDVSNCGVLMRMRASAAVVSARQRLLVSMFLDDGQLHLLGDVTRLSVGTDEQLYVAIDFRYVHDEDEARLTRLLAAAEN